MEKPESCNWNRIQDMSEARYCRCLIMLLQQKIFQNAWEHFRVNKMESETVKRISYLQSPHGTRDKGKKGPS